MRLLRTLPVDRDPPSGMFFDVDAALPSRRRCLDGYHPQLEAQFDPELGALWVYMRPEGVPCFNLGLLASITDFDRLIEANEGQVYVDETPVRVRYYVVASRIAGVFNYGGDLALFAQLAMARDRERLLHYATLCVDNLYQRIISFRQPIIMIALVQGAALGGGFEGALANHIIIAERSSTFGFPEVLFNLFPGMGAYSFLSRLVGIRRAEEMIYSGAIYSAAELAEMGVVDRVAEDGRGEEEVMRFMKEHWRRHNSYSALLQARRELLPISHAELMRITTIWVEAVLRLAPKDLRIMQRLVNAQRTAHGAGERSVNTGPRFG